MVTQKQTLIENIRGIFYNIEHYVGQCHNQQLVTTYPLIASLLKRVFWGGRAAPKHPSLQSPLPGKGGHRGDGIKVHGKYLEIKNVYWLDHRSKIHPIAPENIIESIPSHKGTRPIIPGEFHQFAGENQ